MTLEQLPEELERELEPLNNTVDLEVAFSITDGFLEPSERPFKILVVMNRLCHKE